MIKTTLSTLGLGLLLLLPLVAGHARWACPKPRDEADEQGHHILFDNTGAWALLVLSALSMDRFEEGRGRGGSRSIAFV
jgi:hypothetical protein